MPVRLPPSANHQPRLPAHGPPVPNAPVSGGRRTITPRGGIAIRRVGLAREGLTDIYHRLLSMKWRWLFLLVAGAYVAVNLVFATLYYLEPGAIENARPDSFADDFFFSVQTMATIGYGKMTPATPFANALVTIEALLGMLGIAMATGLIFAKFARASSRVMFSDNAIVTTVDGQRVLAFRVANERSTQIVEAQLTAAVLRDERTREGDTLRRITELPLVRSRSAVFALSWTVMHPIDEKSPLWNATEASLGSVNLEIIVSMVGLEEVTGQTVHARHAYHWSDVRWGQKFADIISVHADGSRTIDYGRFHSLVPDEREAARD
jgi:inward rectifier potassium channel